MSLWMSLNFLVCHVSLVWMGRTCPSSSFCNSSVAVGRVCVCVSRLHFSGVHWIMKHGALSNGTLSDHWPGPVSWLDATLCDLWSPLLQTGDVFLLSQPQVCSSSLPLQEEERHSLSLQCFSNKKISFCLLLWGNLHEFNEKLMGSLIDTCCRFLQNVIFFFFRNTVIYLFFAPAKFYVHVLDISFHLTLSDLPHVVIPLVQM